MIFNSIALSLATGTLLSTLSTVQAITYWGKVTHPSVVGYYDLLTTPKGFSDFEVFSDDVLMYHFGDLVGYFSFPNARSVSAHSDGRFKLTNNWGSSTYYGSASRCGWNSQGTWSLMFDDNLRLYVRSTCGTVAFDNGILWDVFPLWSFEHIHGVKFSTSNEVRNLTAGKGVYTYYLDAGSHVSYVPLLAKFASSASASYADISSNHVFGVVGLVDNYYWAAMALEMDFGVIKITEGSDDRNIVAEPSIIKAFKYIFTGHSAPFGTIQRVIHTSHSFADGDGLVVDCAYQWAFKQGVYIIQPAGNNNVLRHDMSPYVLTIGGYNRPGANGKSLTNENTVYGNTVDLWAPAYAVEKVLSGTSISTAFATAAVANAISYWPDRLRNSPNKGYRYMMELASTHLIDGADGKVAASPRAGTKSLSIARLKTLVPSGWDNFDINTAPNFCGQLGLDANTPNWDALIAKANPNRFGTLVYDTTSVIYRVGSGFLRFL